MKKRQRKKNWKKCLRAVAPLLQLQIIALQVQQLLLEIRMRQRGTWQEGSEIVRSDDAKELPIKAVRRMVRPGENGKVVIVEVSFAGQTIAFGPSAEFPDPIPTERGAMTLRNPPAVRSSRAAGHSLL